MGCFSSLFGPVPTENSTQSKDLSSSGAMGLNLLSYHLTNKGISLRGGSGFLSTAHTDEDINYIIQAVKDSISDLRSGGLL